MLLARAPVQGASSPWAPAVWSAEGEGHGTCCRCSSVRPSVRIRAARPWPCCTPACRAHPTTGHRMPSLPDTGPFQKQKPSARSLVTASAGQSCHHTENYSFYTCGLGTRASYFIRETLRHRWELRLPLPRPREAGRPPCGEGSESAATSGARRPAEWACRLEAITPPEHSRGSVPCTQHQLQPRRRGQHCPPGDAAVPDSRLQKAALPVAHCFLQGPSRQSHAGSLSGDTFASTKAAPARRAVWFAAGDWRRHRVDPRSSRWHGPSVCPRSPWLRNDVDPADAIHCTGTRDEQEARGSSLGGDSVPSPEQRQGHTLLTRREAVLQVVGSPGARSGSRFHRQTRPLCAAQPGRSVMSAM